MLENPIFLRIWSVIKTWDINVPGAYVGYCGATGNHARAVFDALLPPILRATVAEEDAARSAKAAAKERLRAFMSDPDPVADARVRADHIRWLNEVVAEHNGRLDKLELIAPGPGAYAQTAAASAAEATRHDLAELQTRHFDLQTRVCVLEEQRKSDADRLERVIQNLRRGAQRRRRLAQTTEQVSIKPTPETKGKGNKSRKGKTTTKDISSKLGSLADRRRYPF
jgi:hypothetical protein